MKKLTSKSAPIKAVKYNQGKLRLDLNPPEGEAAIARAMTYGAIKYSANNYLLAPGLPAMDLYGAARRHLLQWASGIDLDSESNLNHLDGASASIAMLIETLKHYPENDNRWRPQDGTRNSVHAARPKQKVEPLKCKTPIKKVRSPQVSKAKTQDEKRSEKLAKARAAWRKAWRVRIEARKRQK